MKRTLRTFALTGFLGIGIYWVGFVLYHAADLPVLGTASALGTLLLLANLMQIAAWIGTAFAYVAGVVGAVASVQRRQRWWALALIGVLALQQLYALLLHYFPQLAQPFLPSTLIPAADWPLFGVVLTTPIAVLVLVYSVLPSPATANPVVEAAGG